MRLGDNVSLFEFVHPNTSSLIASFKIFLTEIVYPNRIGRVVVGPVHRSVQYLLQDKKAAAGPGKPILNIELRFSQVDEKADLQWKSPFYGPRQVFWFGTYLYINDFCQVAVCTRRWQFTFDVTGWFPSQMESHDFISRILSWFSGVGRYVELPEFTAYLTLSSDQIENIITCPPWAESPGQWNILKSIDDNRFFYPLRECIPLAKLESLSESNTFYGGETLPEYVVQFSVTVDHETPAYLVFEDAGFIKEIGLDLSTDWAPIPRYYLWLPGYANIRGTVRASDYEVQGSEPVIDPNKAVEPQEAFVKDIEEDTDPGLEIDLPYPKKDRFYWIPIYYKGEMREGSEFEYVTEQRIRILVPLYAHTKLELLYVKALN